MSTILDADIEPAFWPSLETAKGRAAVEAANTGSTVLDVHAIEIQGTSLHLIGAVPRDALQVESESAQSRPRVRPRGFGKFHTTWGALLRPEGTVGFFVLHHPVRLAGPTLDEGDVVRVAVEVKRQFASLPVGFIGPACCAKCNEPIPEQRLRVVPGVKICTKCQTREEKGND